MSHNEKEKGTKGSGNFWNKKEIEEILRVAEYLMKNEYLPGDVTVLCPYREQVIIRCKLLITKHKVKS